MNPSQQSMYDVISVALACMMMVMIVGKAWDRFYPTATKVACAIDVQYQQARVTYIGTGTVYD
jgi:UDP-N-acetylglucosamine:LPS N-acetylglucosamine transferase